MSDGQNLKDAADRISRLEDLCDEILEMVAALSADATEERQTAVA